MTLPPRSFLFAPGNHPRRVEKALAGPADAVILDLEDAVATAEKPGTRAVALAALQSPRRLRGYIRINPADTQFCYGDLVAIVHPGLDGVILPKVETPTQLATIDWLLHQLEHERGLPKNGIDLIPLIETAKGLAAIERIMQAGTRARRAAFGAGDYTLDLDLTWTRDETELLPARSALVLASRAAGWQAPIDTVWVDLKDPEGMSASATRARALGFGGKLCIHPDQIAPVHASFSPSAAEIGEARAIDAAFAEAEAAGLASITVGGAFVDYPIAYRARRVLAAAQQWSLDP